MNQIVIKTARYENKAFEYGIEHRFPLTAKGLTLAVIAADRMMNIGAHHRAYSDILIAFEDGQKSEQLADAQMFDLIGYLHCRLPILDKCEAIMTARAAVSKQRVNKLMIARAAVEDITDMFSITAGKVSFSRDADEIMAEIEAAELEIKLTIHHSRTMKVLGDIVFEDGKDHEIFKSRTVQIDSYLERAFGMINEANDYGEIREWLAA